MEMELNNLIEKIKTEGVEEAQQKAKEIISSAQASARQIIDDADEKKQFIIEQAEKEAQKLQNNAIAALQQASRNVVLALREQIIELSDAVLKREISKELSHDLLKTIIVKAVEGFHKQGIVDVEVLLSKQDKEKLEKALFNELSKETQKGIVLKMSHTIEKGFRIGKAGSDYYYDFTDEAITEALKPYLNSKLIKLLNTAKPSKKNAK